MALTISEMESLAATGTLRMARVFREGVTSQQLATVLSAAVSGIRGSFTDAVLRAGDCGKPYLFSRARVSEMLSELNGREIPFPTEPLLTVEEASEFLLLCGVRLSPSTLCGYRSQYPHLSPPFIRISPSPIGGVRYSRHELEQFAADRRVQAIKQGFRSDLSKEVTTHE